MKKKDAISSLSLLEFTADSRTIRKSAVNSIFIQLIFKLKGIITMPILTYYLSPEELGIFNIILIAASMLLPLFSLNLTDGPVKHFVQEKSKSKIVEMYNTVVNSVFLSFFILVSIFWVVMHKYGGVYCKYTPLVVVLLFSVLIHKLVTYVLVVFQKTSLLVKNTLFRDMTATILSVMSVIAGYSYFGMVAALVIANILAALLVYSITRKELVYSLSIDWKILLQFLNTSLPLLPVFFFSWIIKSSDFYFLTYLKGVEAVGKYSVIYGITGIILSLTFALNFFWYPVSARLWVENREKYRLVFVKVFAGFLTLLLVVVGLFELNSRLMMKLLVRRLEYQDAYVIIGIIAFAFAMQVLITLLTAPLYSNGNNKTIFTSYLFGGITNALLNFYLIPFYGILGAAISTAISYLIIVLLMVWMNYRMADFAFLDRRLFPIMLIFVFAWGGFASVRDSLQFYQLLLVNILSLVVVVTFLYAKVLEKGEKDYLCGMYRNCRLKLGA